MEKGRKVKKKRNSKWKNDLFKRKEKRKEEDKCKKRKKTMHYARKIIIKMLILCILTNIKRCIIIKLQGKIKRFIFFTQLEKRFTKRRKGG